MLNGKIEFYEEDSMDFIREKNMILYKDENGEILAQIEFPFIGERKVEITRTYVSDKLRGQGVAAKLMEAAVAEIEKNGWEMKASCSYAVKWLENNK